MYIPRLSPADLYINSILDRVIRLERFTGDITDMQSTLSNLDGCLETWTTTQTPYANMLK